MHYFCPMCASRASSGALKYRGRRTHQEIAFAADPNNKKLDEWISIAYSTNDVFEGMLRRAIAHSGFSELSLLVGTPVKKTSNEWALEIAEKDCVDALRYAFEITGGIDNGRLNQLLSEKAQSNKTVIKIPLTEEQIVTGKDKNGADVWRSVEGCQKVCGVCRHPISESAGVNDEIVIALLGSERVGKSSVVAATIDHGLKADPECNWQFSYPQNDMLWERFEEKQLTPYQAGKVVKKTDKTAEGQAFVFCISLEMTIPNYNNKESKKRLTITFVDMPGEYLNANEKLDSLEKDCLGLLRQADVFWWCLDCVQLEQDKNPDIMRQQGYDVSNSTSKDKIDRHVVDPNKCLSFLAGKIKPKLNKPNILGAIIYTKIDRVPEKYRSKLPVRDETQWIFSEKLIALSEKRLIDHSGEVLKNSFRDTRWPNELKKFFDGCAYFALSAYGREPYPEDAEETFEPQPYRANWPMDWTLAVQSAKSELHVGVRFKNSDEPSFIKAEAAADAKKTQESFIYERLSGGHDQQYEPPDRKLGISHIRKQRKRR